jgi:hypothetical protein
MQVHRLGCAASPVGRLGWRLVIPAAAYYLWSGKGNRGRRYRHIAIVQPTTFATHSSPRMEPRDRPECPANFPRRIRSGSGPAPSMRAACDGTSMNTAGQSSRRSIHLRPIRKPRRTVSPRWKNWGRRGGVAAEQAGACASGPVANPGGRENNAPVTPVTGSAGYPDAASEVLNLSRAK